MTLTLLSSWDVWTILQWCGRGEKIKTKSENDRKQEEENLSDLWGFFVGFQLWSRVLWELQSFLQEKCCQDEGEGKVWNIDKILTGIPT